MRDIKSYVRKILNTSRMHEKHTDQLPLPKRGDHNAKKNDETRGQRAREDFKT